jgi:drug/metabolite transporter (DMT)-like permease
LIPPAPEHAADPRGIALVLASTVAWGSAGLLVRLLPFDIWTICFWRGIFGLVFIGLYMVWRYGARTFAVIGGLGSDGLLVVVFSTMLIVLFPASFQFTSVANVFAVYGAFPFFTAAIAWLWIGETPSQLTVYAALGALAGFAVMFGPGAAAPQIGDLMALLATGCGALMTVAARRAKGVEMVPVAAMSMLLSIAVSYPLAGQLWDLEPHHYLIEAAFGLGPMTLGLMLYIIGSAMIPSALASLIGMAEVPIGMIWPWVGVGEAPAVPTMIGGAIVLASVVARMALDRRFGANG